jgi:hypothetical protein
MPKTINVTICECGYRSEYFNGIALPAGDWKYKICLKCHNKGKPKEVFTERIYYQDEVEQLRKELLLKHIGKPTPIIMIRLEDFNSVFAKVIKGG